MDYSVNWRDDAENASGEERATVGDLSLTLDGKSVTTHIVRGESEIHDRVTFALYHLAEGLARDWWLIFGGRDQDVRLMRHRGGYAIPDLRLSYDGAALEVTCRQYAYRNPPVSFWTQAGETLSRAEAETQLGGLVELVLERLDERQLRDTGAAARWEKVVASRADPEEAAFCEAAGALGLDPYQIDDAASDAIERASDAFRGEALIEFLSGAKQANQPALMQWVETVDRRPSSTALIPDLRAAAAEAAAGEPVRANEPAWSLGYRRARGLRRALSMPASERVRSFRGLAEKLGRRHYELARPVDGIHVLRSDHDRGVYLHMRKHGDSPAASTRHLFSFTRAVGDVACFPDWTRAPINDLHAAHRQAAGRAFAAQFLAPIDELKTMRDDGHDSISMAEEFGVPMELIARQFENEHRIENALAA